MCYIHKNECQYLLFNDTVCLKILYEFWDKNFKKSRPPTLEFYDLTLEWDKILEFLQ